MLLGAAAQIGVFVALAGAMMLGFNVQQASAIGIIGGADGPTAIYLASKLAPDLLGAIAVAAYSYMSLVPLIQPPIMKLMTTKERKIKMVNLRPVSHFEKVLFPIVVAIVVSLLLPPVAALMGCLCMGNLFEVSGVTARLSDTAQNALINIVTIFLATGTAGLTMSGDKFLRIQTIEIICLGLIAFAAGTAGGVLFGQIMRIASRQQDQPAHRFGRCIGRTDGSACIPGGRIEETTRPTTC